MEHGSGEVAQDERRDTPLDTVDLPNESRGQVASRFGVLAIVSFTTFWTRYFLADKNSYWLDELYSVERYVVQYDTVLDAIRSLAATSIHPPLYQFVLYFWIELFGDGETATRTLSNVYVTLAVIFLHRLVARLADERLANAVVVPFALIHAAMFYGLETRSYAQTLMLSVLSLYAVIAYLFPNGIERRPTWPLWVRRTWAPTLLSAVNVGLMLTHYYNFFFWGAQVLFVAVYLLVMSKPGERLRRVLISGSVYLLQLGVFAAIWGRVTWESYQRNTGRYETDSITYPPLEIIRAVADRNFSWGALNAAMVALLVALLLGWLVLKLWRRRDDAGSQRQLASIGFLVTMLVGPAALAFTAFATIGFERFTVRYVLYLVPVVTVLLALSSREAVNGLVSLARRARADRLEQQLTSYKTLIVGIVLLAMVMPDSMSAARNTKDDWRGVAQDIVAIVEANPDEEYVVYEPAFRQTPVYDYYLSRYSDEVRVQATIRRWVENRGDDGYSFERDKELLEEHDYMIIPFVHHRVTNFPRALELLRERYEVEHWQINHDGKGIAVFAL